MEGRLFGIKKSLLLSLLAMANFLAFLSYIFVSIFYLKSPVFWFFAFCIFVGVFELCKSMLFKYDSCLYLGSLLLFIGIFGFVFSYTNATAYAPFYICLAFVLASVCTYMFTEHNFHLIIAFSILFVQAYCLLYVKNLITLPILFAFLVPFLLLLILEILLACFHKK